MTSGFTEISVSEATKLAEHMMKLIDKDQWELRKKHYSKFMVPRKFFFGLLTHKALTKEEAIERIKKSNDGWSSKWEEAGWLYEKQYKVCQKVLRVCQKRKEEVVKQTVKLSTSTLKDIGYIDV
tara:strand:- start:996 stop:1367 length:372 start_codon:yes stop_codon:yes gene_type:complete